ncbi:hypothetical protein HHI36_019249 [Cryptolaemus montrouzieri]|uniref:Uncharacterized protein n=1 Tax=Cryptolaemus montrouzieri TaxID=559131 RepID=A0ABD2P3F4_9CUCU
MDIMETVQVSNDETINQVQYPQNDFKTTSVIQNYDKMDTNTTYEHSESPYEISLPSTECNNEPIIDASIIESTENISTDYEIITPNTEENTDVEQNNEINHTETIPIEPVDTIEEHIEPLQDQVIVTNSTDNENHTVVIVTTANCTSSDVVLDSNAFIESVTEGTDVNNVVEVEECKITENTADVEKNNSDGQLDNAALSSFISEVDESVSLPPAESPILEDIPRSEEIVEKIEEEFIEKTLVVNEIEIAEAPQDTVISTSEANIQYTVLPPGENSVYQEDGTLVVEYPLHSSLDVNEEESQNSQKFIETAQTLEFVEIPQTEVQEVPAKPGKQPKPKGRKPSGNIPLHILGHNIDKPVQEVPNGKPILKPRLGVKIPYRNLSSQIVSNTELQQQIVERARQKQESQMQVDNSTTFAKKLTHRLAQSLSGLGKVGSSKRQNNLSERDSKIIAATAKTNNEEILSENAGKDVSKNSENDQNDTRNESVEITVSDNISNNNITEKTNAIEIVNVDSSNINVETSELSAGDSNLPADISNLIVETSKCTTENPDSGGKVSENKTSEPEKRSVNIETNSDLIAILEGDGDEGSPIINMPKAVEGVESVENSSELKEIEKEISLSEQKITSTLYRRSEERSSSRAEILERQMPPKRKRTREKMKKPK